MDAAISKQDPVLDEIVRRLIEAYQPERIDLFGSRARGEAEAWAWVVRAARAIPLALLMVYQHRGGPPRAGRGNCLGLPRE